MGDEAKTMTKAMMRPALLAAGLAFALTAVACTCNGGADSVPAAPDKSAEARSAKKARIAELKQGAKREKSGFVVMQTRSVNGKTFAEPRQLLLKQSAALESCCPLAFAGEENAVNLLGRFDLSDSGEVVGFTARGMRQLPEPFARCFEKAARGLRFPPNAIRPGQEPFPRSFEAAMACRRKDGKGKPQLRPAPFNQSRSTPLKPVRPSDGQQL